MIPGVELSSRTDAAVDVFPLLGKHGETYAVVCIKQLFAIDSRCRLSRTPGARVRPIDEPWEDDEAKEGSIRLPSDVAPRKPGTDVLVVGHAVSTDHAPVKSLDVLVRVGSVERIVRVFGPRIWQRGLVGISLSEPQPFVEAPLRWERAFGGTDPGGGREPLVEPRNPVGRGIARDPTALLHQLGPQIEDPGDLVSSPRSRPRPAGLSPIGRHFAPRRDYTGTYDERWKREQMPLPPFDQDDRVHQCACPELVISPHLFGGERLEALHLDANGPIGVTVPRIAFYVGARIRGDRVEHRPVLDTLILLCDEKKLELTWRACIRTPPRLADMPAVLVYEKETIR